MKVRRSSLIFAVSVVCLGVVLSVSLVQGNDVHKLQTDSVIQKNAISQEILWNSGDLKSQDILLPMEQAEKKKVALTFDDGPHPSFTEELLDGLKERGVVATFFVTGEHAELHPDIIKRMNDEGHLIGNHTYSHMQLKSDNLEEFKAELVKTNEVIRQITGEAPYFVRPPYGTWDKSLEEELDMFPVLWSVDPKDWCNNNADCVAYLVERETKENDIILLHDYFQSSVQAALEIVDELIREGYTFVTVDEIMFD